MRMAFCNESFMPSEVSGEQEDYRVVADSWLAEIRQVVGQAQILIGWKHIWQPNSQSKLIKISYIII